MKFTIAIKLTLLVTTVVVVTSGVLGFSVNSEYDQLLAKQELKNMGENTGEEATEILTTIKRMNEDVLFLSLTPPIQGIIRAQQNNGIDNLDGYSEKVWKKRLAIIFKSFLESKPHYHSIRFIGKSNNGKELVRVDRHTEEVIAHVLKDLQNKGSRSYYKKGIKLNEHDIYVSDVEYNRENGVIAEPYQLVMRSVTPAYTKERSVFGVVVININSDRLFEDFLSDNTNEDENTIRYIINSKEEILNLKNKEEEKILKTNASPFPLKNHPKWISFFSRIDVKEISKKIKHQDRDIALYAKKIFLDKKRFFTLVEEKPYEAVIEHASHVKKNSLWIIVALLLPAVLVTVIFSNRFTRPLKNITDSIINFKKNRSALNLDVMSNDEIGALAAAFREMIHDLDQAQEQLVQSEKMASIGQLAAGVAHEINNPVGFIGSNINTLKDYCNDLIKVIDEYEKEDEYLKTDSSHWKSIEKTKDEVDLEYLKDDIGKLISESTDGVKRVKEIVQNLKDFSHVDETEWQWANIHAGLDSTLNIVNNEIKYKAEVIKHYGEIPEVECIASQLNQVFMNLLVNAAHSIEEQGTITIETGLTDSNWVWISITDTGKGIPKELQKNIFDPFFTTKPIGQGTGLGLSLSYGIIDTHSGRIQVDSTEGVGTKFSIWLPVSQKQHAEAV